MKKPEKKSKETKVIEEFIDELLDTTESNSTEAAISETGTTKESKEKSDKLGTKQTQENKASSESDRAESTRNKKRENSKSEKEKAQFQETKDERLESVEKLLNRIETAKENNKQIRNKTADEDRIVLPDPTFDKKGNQSQGSFDSDQQIAEDVSRDIQRAREMFGNEFQILLFDVGEIALAVPLVKLGGIHTFTLEDVTPLFSSPDWFIGLLPSEQGNILLVDTAKTIFPEKYSQMKPTLQYQYAVLLDDTRWALTCNAVKEAKNISVDDVRWSSPHTKREWFSGMVVEHMCALLEVDALINRFCSKK